MYQQGSRRGAGSHYSTRQWLHRSRGQPEGQTRVTGHRAPYHGIVHAETEGLSSQAEQATLSAPWTDNYSDPIISVPGARDGLAFT